jgi:hypothetical protein
MKQRIQIILLVFMLAAGLRVGYIFYERHQDNLRQINKPQPPPLNPDYYVTPKKLYLYDLKTAKQLTQQPAWVKVGYSITYYPYNADRHQADFSREADLLAPLERLQIKDVIAEASPKSPGQKQVMAVFAKDGKTYAFSIGAMQGDDYRFYANDMLFVEDPHTLYTHWRDDIWDAIDKHEVKPGMNELQADFAIGLGVPESGGDESQKTVDYANGGKPLKIVYRNGKAAEIEAGPAL